MNYQSPIIGFSRGAKTEGEHFERALNEEAAASKFRRENSKIEGCIIKGLPHLSGSPPSSMERRAKKSYRPRVLIGELCVSFFLSISVSRVLSFTDATMRVNIL